MDIIGWIKIDRPGWYQNGPCKYEYQAENPCAEYACDRRPKAKVFLNSSYKWEVYRLKWLSETGFKPIPIGKFPEYQLPTAIMAAEQAMDQQSMF